jgi:DNA-binding SARP family transcriptional activator
VLVDGSVPPPEVVWKKHVALLVYLALSPGRRRARDHVLGLLWPEKDERHARHSLNEALRRLRHALGQDRLTTVGDSIELAGDALHVDALEVDGAVQLERNVGPRVDGAFLEGLAIDDAPAFEEWLAVQRLRVRSQAVGMHVDAGERALAASRFDEASDQARRALALHPLAEGAARLAIRAAALAGDPASALEIYHAFGRRLEDDLGEHPSRELAALADRVRGRRWRRRSAIHTDAAPPLAGRHEVHAQVFGLLAGLGRGSRTVVMTGPAGMGRSRLLAECIDRLNLEGTVVADAYPLAGDRDIPWSALRQIMRRGLADAPGLPAAAPTALAVLAAVVPELATRVYPGAALDTSHVAEALTAVLRAVAEESPLALAIDDAQNADPPSLTALGAAVAALRHLPIALLVTGPDDARRVPAALGELLSAVGRTLPGVVVRLAPLSADDVGELVRGMAAWCADDAQRQRLARRLAFESAGSPLLAVTMLHGLRDVAALRDDATQWPPARVTMEAPVPMDIPALIRAVTAARIRHLPERERTVLLAASAGGEAFEALHLSKVVDLSHDEFDAALTELERLRLVRFDGEHYMTEAPLIGRVVLEEFATAGERRRLRDRWEAARQVPR